MNTQGPPGACLIRFVYRRALAAITILAAAIVGPLYAMPPSDGPSGGSYEEERRWREMLDAPNPEERERIQQRLELQQAQRRLRPPADDGPVFGPGPESHGKSGVDRVLIILVEFDGTNTFTWTPGVSTWDPIGKCDNTEFDGSNLANSAASRFFANKYGITGPTNFTYRGPLHNEIARPLGSNDASSVMVWHPDFDSAYYSNIVFGEGLKFDFARQDGSVVKEDFTGYSVRDYYEDLSARAYTITGSILGWVKVTNSVWFYGGDGLPGARSCPNRPAFMGAIPGGGDARTLVKDALIAARAAYPGFDWAAYDQDRNGYIDRLWVIHSGLGEEDNPGVLNRTSYGEGGLWSHSWSLDFPFEIVPGVRASSYIMMPENAGLAVLAHEFGHNLGAMDLYTYGDGQTSAGFWTLMADSWTGFPMGFLPQGMDPMHLDEWGWLEPLIVSDPTRVYSVQLGQASRFTPGQNRVRGVKIELDPAAGGYSHNYWLQWRNTSLSGGYDRSLGDPRFRFGPVNTGLVIWYQDDRYYDNSIFSHLTDPPSFGPKGRLLVVDAHPEPELDPYWVAQGVNNERGNVFSRGSMRDAPFSRWPTASFHLDPPFAFLPADFAGRPAEPSFSDARGYYPGIEPVGADRWRTRQWDASAVLPAAARYNVRGPGYLPGTPLEEIISSRAFAGTNELISYRTNVMFGGLAEAGGDGNPGSSGAALGWNVRLVWQTYEAAEVVIWNARHENLDDDLDGSPNWKEAVAGTNPGDPKSVFRVTRVERDASGVRLEWPGATNRQYRVLRSAQPGGGFVPVKSGIPGTAPANQFLDDTVGPSLPAFYRVEVE